MTVARPAPTSSPARGFSFIEVLIVMGLMGILAALGVGLLQNLGSSSRLVQARAVLLETAVACKNSSNGGTRATFVIRTSGRIGEEPQTLVEAFVTRPVLTADFETLDTVSQTYPVRASGGAKVVEDGWVGRAVHLERGGGFEISPQSAFALTEGLQVDVHVRPEGSGSSMTILRGVDPTTGLKLYELKLVGSSGTDQMDVELWLSLVPEDDVGRGVGVPQTYTTKTGPVRADRWSHVRARFDGREASILVDGLERLPVPAAARPSATPLPGSAAPATPPPPPVAARRIVVPESGAARVVISAPESPFVGTIDALVLEGMFRSQELSRPLFRGASIQGVTLPLRADYVNGRLDPDRHRAPIFVKIFDAAHPQERPWIVTLGLDGEISSRPERPGTATSSRSP